jgi:methanogenic corrinoid protein MtbC1
MDRLPEYSKEKFRQDLLNGNRAECSRTLQHLISQGASIQAIYEQLLKTSLYIIGELWEMNKISVAAEHMASSITENLLSELYVHIQPHQLNHKKAILTCVPGEQHQIGIKMVNDILEIDGWDTFFLGANVPVKDLISFSKGITPDLIAVSMSLYFNLPSLEEMLIAFRQHFPQTPILIGGQAFMRGGNEIVEKFENVKYIRDLYELNNHLKTA